MTVVLSLYSDPFWIHSNLSQHKSDRFFFTGRDTITHVRRARFLADVGDLL